MPLCGNRQAGKNRVRGVCFTRTDPSELLLEWKKAEKRNSPLLLEPGEVEIRCALDVKLVMLFCETEPAPRFPSCSSGVFLQDTVASEGPDRQVLVISSDWLAGELG